MAGSLRLRYATLGAIAGEVGAELTCEVSLIALLSQVERALRHLDRLRIVARIRVDAGQHLENGRLLASGERGCRFKLRHRIREAIVRRQRKADKIKKLKLGR